MPSAASPAPSRTELSAKTGRPPVRSIAPPHAWRDHAGHEQAQREPADDPSQRPARVASRSAAPARPAGSTRNPRRGSALRPARRRRRRARAWSRELRSRRRRRCPPGLLKRPPSAGRSRPRSLRSGRRHRSRIPRRLPPSPRRRRRSTPRPRPGRDPRSSSPTATATAAGATTFGLQHATVAASVPADRAGERRCTRPSRANGVPTRRAASSSPARWAATERSLLVAGRQQECRRAAVRLHARR